MAQSRLPLPLLLLAPGAAALATPATAASATLVIGHWLMPALCYGAGLALTLALAARLTPAAWWRRPTARGALIVAGGTWACGGALALAAGLGMPAWPNVHGGATPGLPHATAASSGMAATPALPLAPVPPPFRAHRNLNLRNGASVGAVRLAVIPAGARLTPTGQRVGDWWQVRADGQHDGRELTGWVSSLWLRRQAEPARPR